MKCATETCENEAYRRRRLCNPCRTQVPSHRDPLASRRSRLRKYGLTVEAYEALLAGQDGKCACCGGPPTGVRSFHVDHDHATGLIRGLLCHNCNLGLGYFKDDEERLMAAVAYLVRSRREV